MGCKEGLSYNEKFKLHLWPGRGWPGAARPTKRQCGLATVRGKHMATNGVVMGGEVTWEKLVQGKLVHKFWWCDILLGKETGTAVTLPKAKARDVMAPGDVARMSDD